MSNIDERVVNMKFNNRQFEANIKATLRSLEGLKKSLNFDASIKSLGDFDRASKKIKIDPKGVQDGAKAINDAGAKIGKSFNFSASIKNLGDLDAAAKKIKLDPKGVQDGAKAMAASVADAARNIKTNLNFGDIGRGLQNFGARLGDTAWVQKIQSGVKTAIGSLGELDKAGGQVDFDGMSQNIDNIQSRFSGLQVAGIAALGAIGAKAAIVGTQMAKDMFIKNPSAGIAEYETNLNSVQTILANTQAKGSTLEDVNGALAQLNTYSDQTIYNFAEMARNIGTFTAAGVDLDTSTGAIKGIANLAALSGSNSQQASTAMYQLSQALSTGKVSLMDWNSVVNAGMGGEVFQEELKQTARNQGIAVDDIIANNGSFRDSLQEGWLTSKVLTETLSKFTGDLTDEQLKSMGYNDEMIGQIQAQAKTAKDAATKVKTFTQLMGTLEEATGSGWAASAQLVLGDFEQAKAMWTSVNDVLGGMIAASADNRNKILGDWNALGGREVMIEAVANAFKALMGVLKPIGEAWREVFPPKTGKDLYNLTVMIRDFTAMLIPGEEKVSLIKNSFKLLFSIFKLGADIGAGILKIFGALFGAIFSGGEGVDNLGSTFSEVFGGLAKTIAESQVVIKFFDFLAKGATLLGTGINILLGFIGELAAAALPHLKSGLKDIQSGFQTLLDFLLPFAQTIKNKVTDFIGGGFDTLISKVKTFSSGVASAIGDGVGDMLGSVRAFVSGIAAAVGGFIEGGFELATTRFRERMESFGRLGENLVKLWENVKAAAKELWIKLEPLRTAIGDMFREIGQNLETLLGDVSFNDVLDMINVGLLGGLVLLFKSFFKKMTGQTEGLKEGLLERLDGVFEGLGGALEGLTGVLQAMQQNLMADTLMKIAIAIGILAISVIALSMIDSGKLTKALVAIAIMVHVLGKAMDNLGGMTEGKGFIKLPFIAASMMLLATAMLILSVAVVVLSQLSWTELIKGMVGTSIGLMAMAKAAEIMSRNPANLIATGIGLIAVAIAIKILASAVQDFSELSFGNMIKGLVGVGAVLTALSIFTNTVKVNKGAIGSAAGLILLGVALKVMASAMQDFAAMNLGAMIQGLVALGIVLTMLANFTKMIKTDEIFKAAAAMVVLAGALIVMSFAVERMGSMDIDTLVKGLGGMAIVLKAVTLAMAGLPKDMMAKAAGMVLVAGAMIIMAEAIQKMGGMDIETLVVGIVAMGVSLAVLASALSLMSGTLAGSAALLVAVIALNLLAPVLQTLGSMPIEQLAIGIGALAAIFLVFGLAGLVLAPLVPVIMGLGIAIGLFGLGLMGVGVGTMFFVTGLLALAAAGAVVGPVLVALVASVLALIPMAMEQLGIGIQAFAKVISESGPIFLAAMVTLITTLLRAIDIVAPKILATLEKLLYMLLDLLVRAVPKMVDAGMKIVIGILEGVANNIGKVVDAATKLIVEFVNSLSRNLPKITNAGADLIISFVNSIADTIRTRSGEMQTAGMNLAGAIIEGMTGGIANGLQSVIDGAVNLGKSALDAAKNILGINSPSKEFAKIGAGIDEGMVLGISREAHTVDRAVEDMGDSAMSAMKKTMAGISAAAMSDVDINPTIRPVLDLSAIKQDAGKIGGMMSGHKLSVYGSYARATSLMEAQDTRQQEVERMRSEEVRPVAGGDTYLFNQTINSPKAVSRAEVYRDTNSLISQIKNKNLKGEKV